MAEGVLQRNDVPPTDPWAAVPGDREARPPARPPAPLPPIDVVVRGDVPHGSIPYAHNKMVRTMGTVDEPILHARLKLTMLPDPAVERPAVAEAVLDVDGDVVRAHVAGRSASEAADLLEPRLRDRLEHRRQHRQARSSPGSGTWRHPLPPTDRPVPVERPAEERELVRHKAFTLGQCTPEEAVFDMESLDYDFHLFVDLDTGQDSVVWRRPDGGYALSRLHDARTPPAPSAVPLVLHPTGAPVLDIGAALERLHAGRERFVFFQEASTGRGNVAYLRVDGHDGLIAPVPATTAPAPGPD